MLADLRSTKKFPGLWCSRLRLNPSDLLGGFVSDCGLKSKFGKSWNKSEAGVLSLEAALECEGALTKMKEILNEDKRDKEVFVQVVVHSSPTKGNPNPGSWRTTPGSKEALATLL